MSKFDKNSESRTVANPPLQQSSFVYFPEEQTIREKMQQNPDLFLEGANAALEDQQRHICEQEEFLRACFAVGEQAAGKVADLSDAFAKTLPQSVFGVGEGKEFLLPLGTLFERIRQNESQMELLLVRLEEFMQPERFDTARFSFFESVVPTANVAKRATELADRGESLRQAAKDFFWQIDAFCKTAVQPFFTKASEAADLSRDGKEMRFGRLAALCGELESAAGRYERQWREKSFTIGESDNQKGNAKP